MSQGGLVGIWKGVTKGGAKGVEGLLSLPSTGKSVMIAMVAIGGLALVLLIAGLSVGIGTGKQDVAAMVQQGVSAAKEGGKLVATKGML